MTQDAMTQGRMTQGAMNQVAATTAGQFALPAHVVQITAPNPGPFTSTGTNTYLIGHETLAVVDPGPFDAAHLAAILTAARGRPITHIVATHAHRDHVDAVMPLQRVTGAATVGYGRAAAPAGALQAGRSPSGADFVDWEFRPDINVADGDRVQAGDSMLEAIHTPGHAPDHLCFAIEDSGGLLLSGDHVMGWSTSVIAPPEGHMGAFLRSLERIMARPEAVYLPGHGGHVLDGPRTARAYLLHRQMREQAVLEAIRNGRVTVDAIADHVYAGLAPALRNAALLSVEAHLELLAEKGLVRVDAGRLV